MFCQDGPVLTLGLCVTARRANNMTSILLVPPLFFFLNPTPPHPVLFHPSPPPSFVTPPCALLSVTTTILRHPTLCSSIHHHHHLTPPHPVLFHPPPPLTTEGIDGNFYQIVGTNGASITWADATLDAASRCYNGHPGYLAMVRVWVWVGRCSCVATWGLLWAQGLPCCDNG